MSENSHNKYDNFQKLLTANIVENFNHCISSFKPNGYSRSINQCLGGLLSRQCIFVLEMLRTPNNCTHHIAPILLRCMIEVYITISWILQKPEERTLGYIEYGIGQQKLINEHLKNHIESQERSEIREEHEKILEATNRWVDAQMADWAIEVNVGSWSGLSLRDMAKQTNSEDLYNINYAIHTSAVHSSWLHIGKFNVSECNNPMHKFHLVPSLIKFESDLAFLDSALRHLSETIELFIEADENFDRLQLPIDFAYDNLPE